MDSPSSKKIVIVAIQLILATLLIAGSHLRNGDLLKLYHCYFADFVLPFGFYFLLCLPPTLFSSWWGRAIGVFGLCAASEILQYFGIYALARTFDPLDFVAYAVGVTSAVILETQFLARYLDSWENISHSNTRKKVLL